MKSFTYSVGIDIGSTTAKVVVLDKEGNVVFGKYRRHYADIRKTVLEVLKEVVPLVGDEPCTAAITGSGGLNLAKNLNLEFVQEVMAVAKAVSFEADNVDAVIELGGEDAKIIFMRNGIEQRMNGICAGGTGAFIDQMAALLLTDASGLNELAKDYKDLYPIAARCGVFAKSDIQPLINDGVSRNDLAASIFQAVVNQTIAGLACGRKIEGYVVFLGGPLFFLSELQRAFTRTLKLDEEHAIFPKNAHLFAARGAAARSIGGDVVYVKDIISTLSNLEGMISEMNCMQPLFDSEDEYNIFKERQSKYTVPKRALESYTGKAFLGIDAGSTTLKMALISESGELLYSYYANNKGDPLAVAKTALTQMYERKNPMCTICYSCSSGYGEELIKNAFSLDIGEVETIAHYYAAKYFEPDVSTILDIGGQDMKCISIKDGTIDNIMLNEACSSGCGSFIENLANSLGYTADGFAEKALYSRQPVDLGTRCTVFMNSNIKQAQKEGAKLEDIAAGLAYSVIKNALFKVIKLNDAASLGKRIVVQGGTFYNNAVLRAFELVAGCEAIRPDIAGLMGAFGAALIAKEYYKEGISSVLTKEELSSFSYNTGTVRCKGCQNQCRLTINSFSNGKRYISGNRCEKGLTGGKKAEGEKVPNLFEYKRKRLFAYKPLSENEAVRGTIGLPRALNMYENYPFWAVFFKELGFGTVLSPFSDTKIFTLGMDSIPSESECYPAKLTHGHIEWLINHGVKTIFYPCVYYERRESENLQNQFNCPMVISYPENIKNNVESLKAPDIHYIDPFIAFTNKEILTKCLVRVMQEEFNIDKKEVSAAVDKAWYELLSCKDDIAAEGERSLEWMEENGRTGIVLVGRPYHIDPEINHGIPEMIAGYGYPVFTEDSVARYSEQNPKLRATNQWTYHARMYAAALFAASRDDLEVIQLNSFGCGVDAVTIDQLQDLCERSGKMHTLLKIDEVNNLGAAKIRVRSTMAALKMSNRQREKEQKIVSDFNKIEYTKLMQDDRYTILCTGMAQPHFDFFEASLRCCNYNMVLLTNEGQSVIDMGLKYVNNDACYPTMIVTGQIIEAVLSGRYDTDHLAVFMVQTGGGCRASNYVAFIRKALNDCGYGHIPVISVNPNGMEMHEGMKYSAKMGFKALQSLIYGDILMKTYNHMRSYEKAKGAADELYNKWHDICIADLSKDKVDFGKFRKNVRNMIREFDALPIDESIKKPRVGIVGEVLVKFMPLANNHLADTLYLEGAEVVIPDFIEFIEYCFWNAVYRCKYLGGGKIPAALGKTVVSILNTARRGMFKELKKSKHFAPPTSLKEVSEMAQSVLQLGNQCGEGWFLAGEIINLVHEGVDNIVCIQPFGCLPNHIVGKGVIKKIKELYPVSNIVAVDYDPSASRVNQLNRIKLMLEVARNKLDGPDPSYAK